MFKKLIVPLVLAFIIALIIAFVPPSNFLFVIFFTLLPSLFFYWLITIFFGKKSGLLVAMYCFLILNISHLTGFNYLNFGLLTSLLIAARLLLK